MKQIQVINAYKALTNLSNQVLPIRISYAIHKLRKSLSTAWDFQVEREKYILEKYGAHFENGMIIFSDPNVVKDFEMEFNELNQMESDFKLDSPIIIPMAEGIAITPNDIDALDGFVIFED